MGRAAGPETAGEGPDDEHSGRGLGEVRGADAGVAAAAVPPSVLPSPDAVVRYQSVRARLAELVGCGARPEDVHAFFNDEVAGLIKSRERYLVESMQQQAAAKADAAAASAAAAARRAQFADHQCDYLRSVVERRDLELDRIRRACLAETVARERLHRRLGEERAASALEGVASDVARTIAAAAEAVTTEAAPTELDKSPDPGSGRGRQRHREASLLFRVDALSSQLERERDRCSRQRQFVEQLQAECEEASARADRLAEQLAAAGPARVDSDTSDGTSSLPRWLSWVGDGAQGGRRARAQVEEAVEAGGLSRGVAAQAVHELLRAKPLAQALCAVAEEEAKEAEGSPPQRLTEPPTVGAADEAGDDHEHGVPKTGEIVSWLSLPRDPEGEDMRLRRALTEIRVFAHAQTHVQRLRSMSQSEGPEPPIPSPEGSTGESQGPQIPSSEFSPRDQPAMGDASPEGSVRGGHQPGLASPTASSQRASDAPVESREDLRALGSGAFPTWERSAQLSRPPTAPREQKGESEEEEDEEVWQVDCVQHLDAPAHGSPAQQAQTRQSAAHGSPAQQAQTRQSPAHGSPAQQAQTRQSPAHGSPAQQASALGTKRSSPAVTPGPAHPSSPAQETATSHSSEEAPIEAPPPPLPSALALLSACGAPDSARALRLAQSARAEANDLATVWSTLLTEAQRQVERAGSALAAEMGGDSGDALSVVTKRATTITNALNMLQEYAIEQETPIRALVSCVARLATQLSKSHRRGGESPTPNLSPRARGIGPRHPPAVGSALVDDAKSDTTDTAAAEAEAGAGGTSLRSQLEGDHCGGRTVRGSSRTSNVDEDAFGGMGSRRPVTEGGRAQHRSSPRGRISPRGTLASLLRPGGSARTPRGGRLQLAVMSKGLSADWGSPRPSGTPRQSALQRRLTPQTQSPLTREVSNAAAEDRPHGIDPGDGWSVRGSPAPVGRRDRDSDSPKSPTGPAGASRHIPAPPHAEPSPAPAEPVAAHPKSSHAPFKSTQLTAARRGRPASRGHKRQPLPRGASDQFAVPLPRSRSRATDTPPPMPTPACARARPGLALGMAIRSVAHLARRATDLQRVQALRGLRALVAGALGRHAAEMQALCARGDRQRARALMGDPRRRGTRTVGDPLPALAARWASGAHRRPSSVDRSENVREARKKAVEAARALVALSATSPPQFSARAEAGGAKDHPRDHYVVRVPGDGRGSTVKKEGEEKKEKDEETHEEDEEKDEKEEEDEEKDEKDEEEEPLVLHMSGLFGSHAAVFALGPHARDRYQRLFRDQEQATSVFQAVASHLALASAAGRDQAAAKRCGAVRGGMPPHVGSGSGHPRNSEGPIPDDPLAPWVRGYGLQQHRTGPAQREREWVWGTRSEPDGGPGSLVFCKFDVAATYGSANAASPPLRGTAQTALSMAIRSYAPSRQLWQTRPPPGDVVSDEDTLPDKQDDPGPSFDHESSSDHDPGACITGAFPVRAARSSGTRRAMRPGPGRKVPNSRSYGASTHDNAPSGRGLTSRTPSITPSPHLQMMIPLGDVPPSRPSRPLTSRPRRPTAAPASRTRSVRPRTARDGEGDGAVGDLLAVTGGGSSRPPTGRGRPARPASERSRRGGTARQGGMPRPSGKTVGM